MNPDRAAAVSRLAELLIAVDRPHPLRVCIDGYTASGKTTLANDLAPAVRARGRPCLRVSAQGFHRPRAQRQGRGHDSAEGYYRDAFDFGALRSVLLEPLGPGGDRRYRTAVLDLATDRPAASSPRQADRRAILVVDGSFLQRPELDELWDFRVWVECDPEVARARGAARDRGTFGPEIDELYRSRYLPAQQLYVDEVDPAARADIRFVNNDPDHPVLVVREGR